MRQPRRGKPTGTGTILQVERRCLHQSLQSLEMMMMPIPFTRASLPPNQPPRISRNSLVCFQPICSATKILHKQLQQDPYDQQASGEQSMMMHFLPQCTSKDGDTTHAWLMPRHSPPIRRLTAISPQTCSHHQRSWPRAYGS